MISEGYVTNGAKVYISSRDMKACEQACKELNALGREFPACNMSYPFSSIHSFFSLRMLLTWLSAPDFTFI